MPLQALSSTSAASQGCVLILFFLELLFRFLKAHTPSKQLPYAPPEMLIRPCRLPGPRCTLHKMLPSSINQQPFLPPPPPPPPPHLLHQCYPPVRSRPLSTQTIARVRITEDRQTVEFFSPDSSTPTVSRRISPTPKAKLAQLETGLARLLGVIGQAGAWEQEAGQTEAPTQAEAGREQAESPTTFATAHWQLDNPNGASISRHFTFATQQARDEAVQRIETLADEARHHPHVALGSTEQQPFCMTVTCTTHQPRGLGVRDVKLATRIGEILTDGKEAGAEQEIGKTLEGGEVGSAATEAIFGERTRLIDLNMRAVDEAIASCACGTKVSKAS